MNDGSITFSTDLDNKELERKLNRLTKKIDATTDKIEQKKTERLPLVEESAKLAANLDLAKAKLYEMQNVSSGTFSTEQIKEQKERVRGLQAEWNRVEGRVERYNLAIKNATLELNRNKEKAGVVAQQLATASGNSFAMGAALKRAEKNLTRFGLRLREVIRGALIFTLITRALASLREWMGNVIKSNADASAAVARLKAALLTLAQPLVNIIIPAFTTFVNILADITTQIAKVVSILFGSTLDQSKEAANALYDQTQAISGTGKAAKKAAKDTKKYFATFDDIKQIGSDTSHSSSGSGTSGAISPDFGAVGNSNWLKDRLGESAELVTAALLLGGVALVALGAAVGRLSLVLAGLLMLGTAVSVGEQTGTLQSWADALGLNDVTEFILIATTLGGIALVAFGAALGNISLLLAGLLMLGTTVAYSKKSGKMGEWSQSLGLEKAPAYITSALLIGGMALIVFGIIMKNIMMLLTGLALLGAGAYVGTESGTFAKWWDVLMLPEVSKWVTPGLLLGGVALLVFGIVFKNIFMIMGGLALMGAGVAVGTGSGTLPKWWDVLSLPQVAQWVETALILGGIGLIVLGICTGNLPLLLAGLGLVGFAKVLSANGGISIKDALVRSIKDSLNAAAELLNKFIDWINEKLNISWDPIVIGGKTIAQGGSFQLFKVPRIPKLATGAVIPPNREFLAVLGDQKSGTNIEAPLSTMVQAFKQAAAEVGMGGGSGDVTIIMELDGQQFGRAVYKANKRESRRVGVSFVEV